MTWTIDNSSLSGLARAFVGSLDKPIKWQTPLNCEIFKYNSSTLWSDLSNGDIALTNSEGFPILRIRWEDWDNYTNEQIKSALSGKYMLYELVTPITYQLEPEEMETLTTYYGVNNFWCKSADYGNSDITYRADVALYIDKISS